MKPHNLAGQRFGRLTVLERHPVPNKSQWVCRCDCGNISYPRASTLHNGITSSCGCLRRERIKQAVTRHGRHQDPLYKVWTALKSRCTNPKHRHWKHYGGKGVVFCEKWMTFEGFLDDMGERPSDKHSIERIDNNGNYCKENCRWATHLEQMQNMSRNVHVTWNDETHTLSEWIRRTGAPARLVYWRHRQGWPPEKMFSTERQKSGVAPVQYTFEGATHGIPEWCQITGKKYGTVKGRLRAGWSFERAITTP